MELNDIIKIDEENYMNTFGKRTPVCFTRGKGTKLYDTEGKEYTDFFAGIAVNVLGHSHPTLVKAITEQAGKMLHCSNLYYNEPQTLLAERINKLAGGGHKVFFANSGAEANEGAIKLVRAYFHKKGQESKNEFITLNNSFHGRTLTTITATAQPKYQKYFTPLTPGFSYVESNDFEALKNAITPNTCAIMLEVVQGESGVHPMDISYLKNTRALCDANDILLIIDEVQTGIGRTGSMFAYQQAGIEPDVFTLAKALGGGVPIGALCAIDRVAEAFEPGDHGTTFGGNPLACSAALAVLDTIEKEQLIENVKNVAMHFSKRLDELMSEPNSKISAVRVKGLMIGIDFKEPVAAEVKVQLFERRYIVGNVGASTLRLLPPLIVTKEEVDGFIEVLGGVVK